MVSVAELKLLLSGKDDTQAAFKSVEGGADGLLSKLGRVGEVMGGVLAANVLAGGVGKAVGFFNDATNAASNLQQSVGGVQSVFGSSADQILGFGKNAAESVGLSKNAFNELAGPLGAMLKNAGFGMEEVSGKTIDLTKRAADMAATFGGPVDQAVGAITAALRGETDPIERYGVSMKAADIEARALADSGKKSAKELTNQELAAARLAILFEQTASAEGQFGREADTAAGKAERLKAKQENLSAQMGAYLLPLTTKLTEAKAKFVEVLATKVVPALADKAVPAVQALGGVIEPVAGFVMDRLVPAFQTLYEQDIAPKLEAAAGVFQTIAGAVGELATAVADRLQGPLTAVMGFLTGNKEILGGVAVAIGVGLVVAFGALAVAAGSAAIGVIAATAPILAIGLVIAGVAAGVIWLVKNWDDLTARYPKLAAASQAVQAAFQAFVSWITSTFVPGVMKLADAIGDAGQAAIGFVKQHWGTIEGILKPLVAAWTAIFKAEFEAIAAVLKAAFGVLQGLFDVFMGVFTGDWGRAWEGLKEVFSAVWNGLKELARIGLDLLKDLIPIAKDIGEDIINGLKDGALAIWNQWVWPFFKGLPSQIKNALGDLSRLLWDVGKAIAQGLLDGLVEGAKAVWGEVSGWGDKIKSLKGPMEVDRTLLKPQGYAISVSLADGLVDGFNEVVVPAVSSMAGAIKDLYAGVPDYVKKLSPAAGGSKSNAGPYIPFDTSWYVGGGQSVLGPGYDDASKIPIGSYVPGLGYKTANGWEQTLGAAADIDAAYRAGTYGQGGGSPAVNFNGPVTIVATDKEEAIRSTRDVSHALRAMGA